MRLRKPRFDRFRPAVSGGLRGFRSGSRDVVREALAIAREMVRIPAAIFMAAAEAAGIGVLAAWRVVWPPLVWLWGALGRALRLAEREITPLRAALAVAAVAALALAASQFADYRTVAIGTGDYSDVQQVAPAPEVDDARESAGAAHAWVGLPLALAGLAVVVACALGWLKNARLLLPIGVAVIAVSLLIDVPKGLDEGAAAVTYEGARASLLGGFWVQLACGALLVVLSPLITSLKRPRTEARRWRVPFGLHAGEAQG